MRIQGTTNLRLLMVNSTRCVQVVTTFPEEALARGYAEAVVTLRLAACVQIEGPIQSWYRWEDRLTSAVEWRCVIKTTRVLLAALWQHTQEYHPYTVPQWVVSGFEGGSEAYFQWVCEQTLA